MCTFCDVYTYELYKKDKSDSNDLEQVKPIVVFRPMKI